LETVGGGDGGDFEEEMGSTPLRRARQPLHLGLNTLQVAASAIATAEPRFALAALDSALKYLREILLPACRAEEATLFVAIDGLFGVTNSCHVMKAQHTTIMRMAGDLVQAAEAARAAGSVEDYEQYLQPLLHGLYALCRAHVESEDEAFVTVLEAMLSAHQAEALAGRYEGACEAMAAFPDP
jgi:hypothetical protein